MGFECRAYGMSLEASFRPSGIPDGPAADGDPLVLELETPAALEARWSGPATPGAWRGRLRDGSELAIRWGRRGDLRFDHDDGRATFLLDPEAGRLGCAPADPEALDWHRVLASRVLPLVAIARGAEALHAGAFDTEAGAVAVLAPSGGGKSSLTAELVGRGRALIADDVLVLTAGAAGVLAQPGCTHLSLDDASRSGGESVGMLGGKHWIRIDGAASEPRPVAALVLLERGTEAAPRVDRPAASPLRLVPFMLGLPDHAEREAARFDLYSDLVSKAPLLRLGAAASDPPAALADELERALATIGPAEVAA
jgi:hypothetical protein